MCYCKKLNNIYLTNKSKQFIDFAMDRNQNKIISVAKQGIYVSSSYTDLHRVIVTTYPKLSYRTDLEFKL